ncbi:MAG: Zn-dependent hydrolase [Actinomycetota bacterium]
MSALRVDGERLWSRLMAMAEVGPGVAGGNNRLAISDDDMAGRDLLMRWAADAGCTFECDEIGNLFATRPGSNPDKPPVLTGSHLDTQPTGGRFDGVYGVLGGLEVIETLNDHGIVTEAPIQLAVWTNEEGSRFPPSMMGSAVWAGALPLAHALKTQDFDGKSVEDELQRLGWDGDLPARPRPLTAAFELHIEQGPILEDAALEIGVVTGVQGYRWYTIELGGTPAHAGPTPMDLRHDPARALGDIIAGVYAVAAEHAPWSRATFAQFRSVPVSPNTVPETITFSLDMRNPDGDVLRAMEEAMRTTVGEACARHGVTSSIQIDADSPPVKFDDGCIAAVEQSADALGLSHQHMVSGAGHDACHVAAHCPTSMIFVPCDDGVSHNEAENISAEQAEKGASVLLGAIGEMAGES